jgi:hypothetical protein
LLFKPSLKVVPCDASFFAAACNLLSELIAAGWLGAKYMLLGMAYRFDTLSNVAKSGVVKFMLFIV